MRRERKQGETNRSQVNKRLGDKKGRQQTGLEAERFKVNSSDKEVNLGNLLYDLLVRISLSKA